MTASKTKAKATSETASPVTGQKEAAQKPARTTLEEIIVERRQSVGLITLNRPKSLNALNLQLAAEVMQTLKEFDADDRIGAVVITGSPRAFAAGADIEEMAEKHLVDLLASDIFADWDQMRFIRKPVIAAVSGFALGGGFELALMCDFIIASHDAQFRPARKSSWAFCRASAARSA